MTFWNSQMNNFINRIHLCSWHPSVVGQFNKTLFLQIILKKNDLKMPGITLCKHDELHLNHIIRNRKFEWSNHSSIFPYLKSSTFQSLYCMYAQSFFTINFHLIICIISWYKVIILNKRYLKVNSSMWNVCG